MAHSNVNAIIDPQLQYHDPRHSSHQYNHLADTRHTGHAQPPLPPPPPPQSQSQSPAHPHTHPRHGGVPYQLHSVHHSLQDPQLNDPHDEESVDGDASGHGSPDDTGDGTLGDAGKTPDKRPRACDSCRGLKVKCIIDPTSGLPCKRCAKARRQCIVTPPTRKRQKKADGRVAELERKIDALTATLAAREASVFEGGIQLDQLKAESASPHAYRSPQYTADQRLLGTEPSPRISRQEIRPNEGSDKRRRVSSFNSDIPVAAPPPPTHRHKFLEPEKSARPPGDEDNHRPAPTTDPEGRGSIYNEEKAPTFTHSDIDQKINDIIDPDTAERLFDRYVNIMVPRFPAVPFPPGTKASMIRKEKPVLFLAILSSTSFGTGVPDAAQKKLEAELRDVFAKAMWKHGEKSLELVQALQVATLWYRPPANFEQHMFYQMVHMSAVMAIDIGIGKRMSPWKQKWFGSDPPPLRIPHSYDGIEAKRAWVVCYFLCISITMILRRPILVRFTDYMKDCIEILETSEDALPTDKKLCQHVRIAHICEDIATQFAMDDPAINYTVTDRNVTFGIKHYEKALAEIRDSDTQDHALRLAQHVTNLYLHEIALHSQSNVDDFKGSWIQETFKTAVGDTVLGPEHIRALTACQQSCRDILDTFLSYDFEVIYVLPVIFSVRVIYAVVVIIKLYIAANSPGEIATVIKREDLQVEQYLDKLQKVFKRVMQQDALSPHVKFLWVIERLQERWQSIKAGNGAICLSNGKTTPLSATDVKPPSETKPPTSVPAQGLHLLSEVAMSGNQQVNNNSQSNGNMDPALNAHPQSQAQPPPQQQQTWYAQQPQVTQAAQIANLPMDPNAYMYAGNVNGYDGFDYGIGTLGMSMDGAISGLFVPDVMWSFGGQQQPPDPNNPHNGGFQGWQ